MKYLLAVIICVFYSTAFATPKIAWFSILNEDLSDQSGFWHSVHDLVVAAAEDLDIDLDIYYANENFINMGDQVKKILDDPKTRPEGILFHNHKNIAERVLRIAENHQVKSFIFNSGFKAGSEQLAPRTKFKHWIGQMLPDDEFAGAELMRELFQAAKSLSEDQSGSVYHLLAFEGSLGSQAYLARKRGLKAELNRNSALNFLQYFPANWSKTQAQKKIPTVLARYPAVQIIWSGNDNMALGVIEGAKASGYSPGKDFVTGGVDWLPASLEAINSGEMAVSVGGHFVEGMWALILLYDYLNGYDFAAQYGSSFLTKMIAINRQNVDQLGGLESKLKLNNLRKVDFSQYSKSHSPKNSTYDFAIDSLLSKLWRQKSRGDCPVQFLNA